MRGRTGRQNKPGGYSIKSAVNDGYDSDGFAAVLGGMAGLSAAVATDAFWLPGFRSSGAAN